MWLSHPGITTRSAEDTVLMLDVLAQKNDTDFASVFSKNGKLRIGVADNFRAEAEVAEAFEKAVAVMSSLGHEMKRASVPFGDPNGGVKNIEADRKSIAGRAFKDVDVLLLPTTATTVLTVKDAGKNPQALSPENTAFANYYGLPAISLPCGFDSHGLPLAFQIVGKPRDDGTVLRLAHQYETVRQEK